MTVLTDRATREAVLADATHNGQGRTTGYGNKSIRKNCNSKGIFHSVPPFSFCRTSHVTFVE
jgi:hypothetical protein